MISSSLTQCEPESFLSLNQLENVQYQENIWRYKYRYKYRQKKQVNFLRKCLKKAYKSSEVLNQHSHNIQRLQQIQNQKEREYGCQNFNRYQKKIMKFICLQTINILNMDQQSLNIYLKKLLPEGLLEILMDIIFFIVFVIKRPQTKNSILWNTFFGFFKKLVKVMKDYQGKYELQIKLWSIFADILLGNKIAIDSQTIQRFIGNYQIFQNIAGYLKNSFYRIRYDQLIIRYLTSEQGIFKNRLSQDQKRTMNLLLQNFKSTGKQEQEWCYTTLFHFIRIIDGQNTRLTVKDLQEDQQLQQHMNNSSISSSYILRLNRIVQELRKRLQTNRSLNIACCMIEFNRFIKGHSKHNFQISIRQNISHVDHTSSYDDRECFICYFKRLTNYFGVYFPSIKWSDNQSHNIYNHYHTITSFYANFKSDLANRLTKNQQYIKWIQKYIFKQIYDRFKTSTGITKQFISNIKGKLSQYINEAKQQQFETSKRLFEKLIQKCLLCIYIEQIFSCLNVSDQQLQDTLYNKIILEHYNQVIETLQFLKRSLTQAERQNNISHSNVSRYSVEYIRNQYQQENIIISAFIVSNETMQNQLKQYNMRQQIYQTSFGSKQQIDSIQEYIKPISNYLTQNSLEKYTNEKLKQRLVRNSDAGKFTLQDILKLPKIDIYKFIENLFILSNELNKQSLYSQITIDRLRKIENRYYLSHLYNSICYYSNTFKQDLDKLVKKFTDKAPYKKKIILSKFFKKNGKQIQDLVLMNYNLKQNFDSYQFLMLFKEYGSAFHKVQVNDILKGLIQYHHNKSLTIFNQGQKEQILSLVQLDIPLILNLLQRRIDIQKNIEQNN